MPPRVRISKELILNAALRITCEEGFEAVNARSLAAALGCSTRPLFTCYPGMEQLKQDFLEHAFSVYLDYAQAWQRREREEPALVFPLSYIAFARQQPRLFEALFVRHMDLDMTRPEDFYREPGNGDRAADFARAVGLAPQQARAVFLDLFFYAHGMAVLTAAGKMTLEPSDARAMVRRMLEARVRRELEEDHDRPVSD